MGRGGEASSTVLRAKELGRLGTRLFKCLTVDDLYYSSSSFQQQIEHLEDRICRLEVGSLRSIAFSLLICKQVVQVEVDSVVLVSLIKEAFPALEVVDKPVRLDLDREQESKCFTIKSHPGARLKTNIWFTEAWAGLNNINKSLASDFRDISHHMRGFTNDQAAACLLQASGMCKLVAGAADLAVRMVKYPDSAKDLTKVIKSLGLNRYALGALVCEGNVLQGKGIGTVDMVEEVKKRVGAAGIANTPDIVSDREAKICINKVLDEELDMSAFYLDTVEDHWSKRWLWCTNGGHSRARERNEPEIKVSVPGRVHRKVAMEDFNINWIKEWNGKSYTSASLKLEPGKTRLILSSDTVSYAAFDHLLSAVEGCWRNKRTLLSPGKDPSSVLADRIKSMDGSCYLMLDFDDFNSHHTNRLMKLLFRELCTRVNYPKDLADRLVNSFDLNRAFVDGVDMGWVTATLMSGHRGTTFINSCCNTIYCMIGAGKNWASMESIHTGDDVLAKVTTTLIADEIVDGMKRIGCRLNRFKQSMGRFEGEFLRCCYGEDFATGYYPRAVIEAVNGNWVSENILTPEQGITNLVGCARTLINRSRNSDMVHLLLPSARRFVKAKQKPDLLRLLKGQIALGDGPIYSDINTIYIPTVLDTGPRIEERLRIREYPSNATEDYLKYHVRPLEAYALKSTGLGVKDSMMTASYAKSMSSTTTNGRGPRVKFKCKRPIKGRGSILLKDAMKTDRSQGVLEKYPLIMMLRDRLTGNDLRSLLKFEGVPLPRSGTLMEYCFGGRGSVRIIKGIIPYSEAAALSQKTFTEAVVLVKYNIYF